MTDSEKKFSLQEQNVRDAAKANDVPVRDSSADFVKTRLNRSPATDEK